MSLSNNRRAPKRFRSMRPRLRRVRLLRHLRAWSHPPQQARSLLPPDQSRRFPCHPCTRRGPCRLPSSRTRTASRAGRRFVEVSYPNGSHRPSAEPNLPPGGKYMRTCKHPFATMRVMEGLTCSTLIPGRRRRPPRLLELFGRHFLVSSWSWPAADLSHPNRPKHQSDRTDSYLPPRSSTARFVTRLQRRLRAHRPPSRIVSTT